MSYTACLDVYRYVCNSAVDPQLRPTNSFSMLHASACDIEKLGMGMGMGLGMVLHLNYIHL